MAQILFNDKPCFTLVYYSSKDSRSANIKDILQFQPYINEMIVSDKKEGILNSISFCDKNTVSKDAKLFFCKSSKFPRTRLTNTAFSRVIKPDKADYLVINKEAFTYYGHIKPTTIFVIETNNSYYFIGREFIDSCLWTFRRYHENEPKALSANTVKFIRDQKLLPESDNVIIGSTKDTFNVVINKDLISDMPIILNKNFKFITDEDLSYLVDNQSESFTEESLSSISDMLLSSDSSVQSLGLKLLSNYNIEECKDYIHFIICSNANLSNCSAWTSVSVKELLKKINFYTFYGRGDSILYRNEVLKKPKNPIVAKVMTNVIKKEVTKALKNSVGKCCENTLSNFGLNINLSIEELV